MKEALLYEKLESGRIHCFLCAHQCKIDQGGFGFCGIRENRGGILFTHSYGRPVALQVDPVEKKPLYHFLPGTSTFSLATFGCNFRCGFCQNWRISQASAVEGEQAEEIYPQELVNLAQEKSCRSISYTYTEPTIYFEYALDTARIAKDRGLYNIFVTNGYMSRQAILAIKPYLDAANIDLKFFKETSYREICSGSLGPVLDSISLMHELGIWIELTTLVIPGVNDSDEELGKIAEYISGIDKNIPWHVSGFHPEYKFKQYPITSAHTLERAEKIGREAGLNYVYSGNLASCSGDTYCGSCKKLLIRREGFEVKSNLLDKDKCCYCQAKIPGVFKLMLTLCLLKD